MRRTNYFLAIAMSLLVLGFAATALLAWSIAKHAGATSDAAVVLIANLTTWMGVAVALVVTLAPHSTRPSKLPRIENLRIAGKYSGKSAAMGISPLDLRS